MNQDTKNQINLAIIKRVRKELLINKAPLSAYWLADRIKTIEIQIPEKTEDLVSEPTYSASRTTSNNSSIRSITVDPDMINESITNSIAKDFYFDDDKIGLKIFWEHEVYNLIKSFFTAKNDWCSVSELVVYIKNLIVRKTTILPLNLTEEHDGSSELISMIWKVLLQFPKIFKLNSQRSHFSFQKKEDLNNFIAKIIFQRGNQLINNNEYFSRLGKEDILDFVNNTEYYFKDYQKPLAMADLNAIQKSNNNWFDDYENYLIFKDLEPIKEKLRNNFGKLFLPNQGTALFAFYFIGDNFPLPEAESFVKLSRIVYMRKYSWTHYSQISDFSDAIIKKFELWSLLTSLIPDNRELTKWYNKNIVLSYALAESLPYTLDQIYPKLISYYSPIFNIEDNPGNLFRLTIQEKLEEQKLKTK